LQDPPKFTQIGIFGLKNMPSGNPGKTFRECFFTLEGKVEAIAEKTCCSGTKSRRSWTETGRIKVARCLFATTYQKGGKYTKLPQNIPNGHDIYKIPVK
jgi:hypothetical protein